MMSRPRISVIMPAYNCELYVRKAIDSILGQTLTDFELVVCDDGSTDGTWKVIDGYTDPRIRKYRHEKNTGYLAAYNHLLTLATGELITCQDADDWSDPRRLELQEQVFRDFPDVSLVGTNGIFYYSDSKQSPMTSFEEGYITLDNEEFKFVPASIMYRREVLEKVNGLHPYFDRLTSMDQYFIMSVLADFKGYAINRYLYFAWFNPASNHRTLDYDRKLTIHEAFLLLKKQRLATGSDRLLENRQNDLLEFENNLLRNRTFLAEKVREYAVYKIDAGNAVKAVPMLLRAWWLDPLHALTYRSFFYCVRRAFGR